MKVLFILMGLMANLHAKSIKIMSYNAHNLFDTEHDAGKNDWEYLPKNYPGKKEACEQMDEFYKKRCLESDWTAEKLELKVSQLTKVIAHEKRPDILALSEVENKNAVLKLITKLGYNKFIITNSPDHRGIDVALAFDESADIKFIEAKEYLVDGTNQLKEKPTRNILEVVLEINKTMVSIFVNHWPSQGNPTINRVRAAEVLKRQINKRARKNKNHQFIAVGDFNTIDSDFPHPFKSVLLTDFQDPRGDANKKKPIANLIGKLLNKPNIVDLHQLFMDSKDIDSSFKKALPKGTYFYRTDMTWNMLDKIFVSKNTLDNEKLSIDLMTYKIEMPSFATRDHEYTEADGHLNATIIRGIPFSSDHSTMDSSLAGYSDHFPVSFEIKINN